MESSTMDNSTRGTILQQQPNLGTIIYSSKDNAWQPMVTPISIMPTEIPKESIIANTDFTMTSVIAKRRLSNKKRRSLQRISGSADDNTLSQHSPPLSISKRDDIPDSSTMLPSSSAPILSSSTTIPSSLSTSSSSHTAVSTHPYCTSQHQGVGVVNGVMPPGATQPCIPLATQVYSQTVPPEVVYQILHQHDITPAPATSSRGAVADPHLPAHQLQYIESSTGQHLTYPIPPPPPHQPSSQHQPLTTSSPSSSSSSIITTDSKSQPQHVINNINGNSLEHQMVVAQQQAAAAYHHHQQQLLQQQQQLAMMQQLYGVVTPATGLVPAASASNVTHPSSIPDMHQLQGTVGVPIVGHPNQLISVPIQTVYAPSTHHSVPIATFGHPDLLLQVHNGSWVSQSSAAPPIYGSCIVNPIQPGLLASSLVK